MKRPFELALATTLASAFLTGPAFAYLDAGSVSMALQVVVGGVASALLIGKMHLSRITGFFRRETPASTTPETAQGDHEQI